MDNSTLIIAYLEGEIKGKSLREFEARLQADSDLQAELKAYQDLYADLEELKKSEEAEREVMEALETGPPAARSRRLRGGQWKWWGLAAGVLLLCAFLFWASPITDVGHYIENYPGLFAGTGIDRTGGGEAERLYAEGLGFYAEGAYAEALAVFEMLPSDFKGYREGLLYQGSCLLMLGRPGETIALITPLSESGPEEEYALWFLSIAHLHKGDQETAKTYLERMTTEPGDFKDEEAAKILKKLRWGF